MAQKLTIQTEKSITITSKNIVPLFRRAVKMMKKWEKERDLRMEAQERLYWGKQFK